jgi:hypothetical protein
LFRYNRFGPTAESIRPSRRTLTYNVVTKEYKVSLGPSGPLTSHHP